MKTWLLMLSLGVLGLVINTLLGFQLIQDTPVAGEGHLVTALVSLFLILLAQIMVLSQADTIIKRAALVTEDQGIRKLSERRSQSSSWTFLSLGLSVMALITGTMAHPGQMPYLHLILGLGLLVSTTVSLIQWARFHSCLTTDKANSH